jgi:hypothetical protein
MVLQTSNDMEMSPRSGPAFLKSPAATENLPKQTSMFHFFILSAKGIRDISAKVHMYEHNNKPNQDKSAIFSSKCLLKPRYYEPQIAGIKYVCT